MLGSHCPINVWRGKTWGPVPQYGTVPSLESTLNEFNFDRIKVRLLSRFDGCGDTAG